MRGWATEYTERVGAEVVPIGPAVDGLMTRLMAADGRVDAIRAICTGRNLAALP
mgnify:CR=1 FL=1